MVSMVFSSCNYLDVMPDERAKIEDSYNTPSRTEGFLYSCYSYLPKKRMSNIGSTISVNPIDRLTGKCGEHEVFSKEIADRKSVV